MSDDRCEALPDGSIKRALLIFCRGRRPAPAVYNLNQAVEDANPYNKEKRAENRPFSIIYNLFLGYGFFTSMRPAR